MCSPDGAMIASGSSDGSIKLWDGKKFSLMKTLEGHGSCVNSVAFTPDSSKLVSGGKGDRKLRLWDVQSMTLVRTYDAHTGDVNAVAASHDGNIVASGAEDKSVRLWSTSGPGCIKLLDGHSGGVLALAFSVDERHLASGSKDKTIRIWDIRMHSCVKIIADHTNVVNSLMYSPNGCMLASGGGDNAINLFDANNAYMLLGKFTEHLAPVRSLLFDLGSVYLMSSSDDKTIRAWDIIRMKSVHVWPENTSGIMTIAASPKNVFFVSGSADNVLYAWKLSCWDCGERFEVICMCKKLEAAIKIRSLKLRKESIASIRKSCATSMKTTEDQKKLATAHAIDEINAEYTKPLAQCQKNLSAAQESLTTVTEKAAKITRDIETKGVDALDTEDVVNALALIEVNIDETQECAISVTGTLFAEAENESDVSADLGIKELGDCRRIMKAMQQLRDKHTLPKAYDNSVVGDSPDTWNIEQCCQWATRTNQASLVPLFKQHRIAGDVLFDLNINTISTAFGLVTESKKTLKREISKLKDRGATRAGRRQTMNDSDQLKVMNFVKQQGMSVDEEMRQATMPQAQQQVKTVLISNDTPPPKQFSGESSTHIPRPPLTPLRATSMMTSYIDKKRPTPTWEGYL